MQAMSCERNLYFNTIDISNKSANDSVSDILFVNTSINPIDANFQLIATSFAIYAALAGQLPTTDIYWKSPCKVKWR
jgi:hypothetical protein